MREKSGKCQGILFCPVCMNPEKNHLNEMLLLNTQNTEYVKQIDIYIEKIV